MRPLARQKWGKWHLDHYPDSFAAEYVRNTNESFNHSVLSEILSKSTVSLAPEDALVVHLRIGDALDGDFPHLPHVEATSVKDYLEKQQAWPYIRPMSHFRQAVRAAKKNGIKSVVLVAASHTPKYAPYPRSRRYISRIKSMIERRFKLPCNERFGKRADEDFAFMSSAKHLCLTGGNFSVIAYLMAKSSGCTIYGGLPEVRPLDKAIFRLCDSKQKT